MAKKKAGRRARSHKEAGIRWRVSEAIFPGDILAEEGLQRASPEAKGAWLWSFFQMWGCTTRKAKAIVDEIAREKIGDVTPHHEKVTLICRRLRRKKNQRVKDAQRQADKRDRDRPQAKGADDGVGCHGNVTDQRPLPSSSSSPSSSPPPLKGEGGEEVGRDLPPLLCEEGDGNPAEGDNGNGPRPPLWVAMADSPCRRELKSDWERQNGPWKEVGDGNTGKVPDGQADAQD